MRCLILFLAGFAVPALGLAQTNATGTAAPVYDNGTPAESQVPKLHAAWKAEHDPARRASLGGDLVDAIIHEFELPQNDIADEVSRDGLPVRSIAPPTAETITLRPLTTLTGVHTGDDSWANSPVFRRLAPDRVEVWTSTEGWLIDGTGKLLTHVSVPRRDGTGRDWFGAFLPDGMWITTDLWEEDKQLNAFSPQGKWLWELQGADILKQVPRDPNSVAFPSKPTIGWARADRIGRGWVVSVGEDLDTTTVLVSEEKTVAALPAGQSDWDMVQPRAMGVRGFYTGLSIPSDDGKLSLGREEPMHGPDVGWPVYSIAPGTWSRTIRAGNYHFGFWPRSHAFYVEADGDDLFAPRRVWFFDDKGRYAGEIAGSFLGDAGNKYGLLFTVAGDAVVTLMPDPKGPVTTQARAFTWPDGSHAVPLAIFDDLQLGFFLRGPQLEDANAQTASRARAAADIVLAKWRL